MTGEQLSTLAGQFTDALIGVGSDMRLEPEDLALVASVAAVNLNVRVHGAAGIEHVRTAADAAEHQWLAETKVP